MTEDEARADARFPELVAAYAEALGPKHHHGSDAPERFAARHLATGNPVLAVFRGGMLVEPGKPTKTIEAPAAEPSRDPKHNPKSGDVIEDEGWTFTVTSYGLDEKNRKIVRYTVAWTHEGEARTEERTAQLGAWRHLWRQADERAAAPSNVVDSIRAADEALEAREQEAYKRERAQRRRVRDDRDVKPENVLPEQGVLFS